VNVSATVSISVSA